MDQELLAVLPALEGKSVCILQGNGRLANTELLVKGATQVVTVDCKMNPTRNNKDLTPSSDYLDHVTMLLSQKRYDCVYCDDVFAHLTEKHQKIMLRHILAALRTDGHFLCVEQTPTDSDFPQNDGYKDRFNALLTGTTVQDTENEGRIEWVFGLVFSRPFRNLLTSEKIPGQRTIWLLQKIKSERETYITSHSLHDVLNNKIYTTSRILQFETIFGRSFISTGGLKTTKEFVKRLDLQASQKVLDVGCGVGGSAFYMSKVFGVSVMAIDLASKMIEIGRKRAEEFGITNDMVQFETADARRRIFPPSSFDVVYSRDAILHIPDKLQLFRNIFRYLKPGGKLLVTDYCCSEGSRAEEFKSYLRGFGYVILTPVEYCKVLTSAGFLNVDYEDKTELFIKTTTAERQRLEEIREHYIKKFSEDDYEIFLKMMKNKEKCAGVGDQVWAKFYAEKP